MNCEISRNTLLRWLQEGKHAGKDFLLVDLRKQDHNGGFLRGSLNLPMESLYPALSTVYELCKNAGIRTVIWYCGTSCGRGNRAAAWFADYVKSHGSDMRSVVLLEGIRGWAAAGPEFTEYIDEYVPEAWEVLSK